MQNNIDRSATEIKCSIGVDGTTQDACSTVSNGKLSQTEYRSLCLKGQFNSE